jgi:hypothetical protein
VFFVDDKLARVGGDVVAETAKSAAAAAAAATAPNQSARVIEVPGPVKKD